MTVSIDERAFETAIVKTLVSSAGDSVADYGAFGTPGGFRQRNPSGYDKSLCLIPEDLTDFLIDTQPKLWAKYKEHYGEEARTKIVQRVAREIEKRGTIDVLRNGVKDAGCRFDLAFFPPPSGLNEALESLHAANVFSVIRQLKYSQHNENSLDLALFLNGIPLFTAKLKNHLTGQTVQNAIVQYQKDRDPKDPLFQFGRCLAHFAVDPELVFITTRLERDKTRFLPFDQGYMRGAGNPPSKTTYTTAYLWERVWTRRSILNLVRHFIHRVNILDKDGQKTGKHAIIFPRYQQLDAVRKLITHAKQHGAGQRYLIQHSAGSSKSNTIAWLAHQLISGLHALIRVVEVDRMRRAERVLGPGFSRRPMGSSRSTPLKKLSTYASKKALTMSTFFPPYVKQGTRHFISSTRPQLRQRLSRTVISGCHFARRSA